MLNDFFEKVGKTFETTFGDDDAVDNSRSSGVTFPSRERKAKEEKGCAMLLNNSLVSKGKSYFSDSVQEVKNEESEGVNLKNKNSFPNESKELVQQNVEVPLIPEEDAQSKRKTEVLGGAIDECTTTKPVTTQNSCMTELDSREQALLKFQSCLNEEMNQNEILRDENKQLSQLVENIYAMIAKAVGVRGSQRGLLDLVEELCDDKKSMMEIHEDLEEKKDYIEQIQYDLEECNEEIKDLRMAHDDLKERNKILEERIEALEINIEKKAVELRKNQERLKDLEAENKLLNDKLKELYSENDNQLLQEENVALKSEIERLTSELQSSIVANESHIQKLNEEVSESNSRALYAEKQLDDIKHNSVSSFQNVLSDVGTMRELLSQTTSIKVFLEAECDKLKEELSRVKCEKVAIDNKYQETYHQQKMYIKDLIMKNNHLNVRVTELEQTNSDLRNQVVDSDKSIQALKQQQWNLINESRKKAIDESVNEETFERMEAKNKRTVEQTSVLPIISSSAVSDNLTSTLRVENEVIRQSLVIKELRTQVSELQKINAQFTELQKKHEVLLQIYGESLMRENK